MPLILDESPSPDENTPFSNEKQLSGKKAPPFENDMGSFATGDTIERSPRPHIDPKEERRRKHHEADVVVVGAGILGSAIATTMARQGRSVILLEKSLKQPDRIVGELLQPGGVRALEKLGLRDCLDGIDAIPVHGYECIYHGEPVSIPYPPNNNDKARQRRSEGRSFHHGRFIQKLREKAIHEPNVMVVETTATDLVRNSYTGQVLGVKCKTKGELDYYFGNLTIVCDGYASTFRKSLDQPLSNPSKPSSIPPNPFSSNTRNSPPSKTLHPHAPTSKSKFYGLELQDCPLPSPYHGHVVLSDQAPVLLYQIGTHETRILVDVPADTPTASVSSGGVKSHLRNVVMPTLPASVQPSFDRALAGAEIKKQSQPTGGATGETNPTSMITPSGASAALRSMPNSFLPPSTNTTPGLALLGDAMNMRHPLTGGGMTVAFTDVLLLRSLLCPSPSQTSPYPTSKHEIDIHLGNSRAVLHALRQFHWRRKRLSSVINILAQALYSLFAAGSEDKAMRALQLGCFRYFQLGGMCVEGPVGLLAGLTERPWVLVGHFFAVAAWAGWLVLKGEDGLDSKKGREGEKVDQLDGPADSKDGEVKHQMNGAEMNGKPLTNGHAHTNGNGNAHTAAKISIPSSSAATRIFAAMYDILYTILSLPYRFLFTFKILWKACIVIFPYIWAELRP
ncbi:MAG: Squalene epoxidase [Alyxoria varia]|nr:MAG: Squalene epoxidase [Alyxoria varia]